MANGYGDALGERTPTAGERLPNGCILDLVREEGTDALGLIVWNKSKTAIAGQFKYQDKTYIPLELEPSFRAAVQLPARAANGVSPTSEFCGDIGSEIARFTGLSGRPLDSVVYFILGTWLVDCVPIAPFLSIVAPARADGVLLLQLLASFCRRSLLLSADGPTDLWTVPMHLHPTLLLDAAELSAPVRGFLRSSNRRGIPCARKGKILDLYCAKAICTQEPIADRALASSALQITLPPKRRQLPVLTAEESRELAQDYQAELLRYRLENIHRVCPPQLDVSELTAAAQGLARSLAACILDDPKLQSEIVPLLRSQDGAAQVQRSAGMETVILEGLLVRCHEGKKPTLLVAELAATANSILVERGESIQFSPESVGWKLRSLGLRTEPIGSGGNGLWLSQEMHAKIHRLAFEFGLPLSQLEASTGCPHCSKREGKV